jgi:glycosyltransferase involved in cell wall biosynthesis
MKVSIGIPFYNPGKYFKVAISSVLQQTFQNFELILLDDGSTDNSLAIAQSFNDQRIRVISDGQNRGLPARLNELINLSAGEYIARMDADDLISHNRIALQVEFLIANPQLNLVSTGVCSITNHNKVIGYRESRHQHKKLTTSATIFGRADIAHATIMARKSWYQRNYYNEKAKLMEDYQLWIDASIRNDLAVGYLSAPLYFYREESSVSSKKAINAYRNQFKTIYDNYFTHLNFIEKVHFTILSAIKITAVYALNLFSHASLLLKLRNKNTQQDSNKLRALQNELDLIRLNS